MVADLTKTQLRKLQSFPMVADIEDEGMDEGRFFVHLKAAYCWPGAGFMHTKSFGSFKDANYALSKFK